ncbi:MAG: Gfo/Idh/MocA family oxidoreductase [Pseudomonadota bacterium]
MPEIGIGIIGGGYMGKAHAAAHQSVGALFNTRLRPRLEMVAASSAASAEKYRQMYGFLRAAQDWRELVSDERVEAVVIASPQSKHRAIAEAAFSLGKPVFCEKPLGASLDDSRAMVVAAEQAGVVNMIGFNYIRTPVTQYARKLIADGVLGDVTWFRGEHTEDFLADPRAPSTWRTKGRANGTMGDLSPHMINCALGLMGPIEKVIAEVETVHPTRVSPEGVTEDVTNDDHAQFMCRFANGVMGHLYFSRVATGRKMGYAYEVHGTKGSIKFDQEDQNALWLYRAEAPEGQRGFSKILAGPEHPDYLEFCQGPGHGTGFQDGVIIEAKDFLEAIADGQSTWPTFKDGLMVNEIIEAAHRSAAEGRWTSVSSV